MKIRLTVIIFAILLIVCGCASMNLSGSPKEDDYQRLKSVRTAQVNEIILLDVKSPVRLGEKGGLAIQGKAGTRYTVTAVYDHTGRTLTTTAGRIAGPDGLADWSWDVDKGTVPGTYRLLVRGDGKMLTTAYTVVAK
jgi:hypothetical protein